MSATTPQKGKPEKYWLKPRQVEAMRDAVHTTARWPERDDAIITLMYDTGLRRAETSALDLEMLDLEDSLLYIPSHIQKQPPTDSVPDARTFALDPTGELHTVRTMNAYMNRREGTSDAVFVSERDTRLGPRSINERIKAAARAAGVRPYKQGGRGSPSDVSAHTLRHSVAWRMMRAEDDNTFYDVRNRLRHASIQTTENEYDHFQVI